MGDFPIVKQFAEIFGFVMRMLYIVTSYVGIHNIALCVVLFVVISKIIMIPSTYKKQKLAMLSPKITPIIKDKLTKYENKLEHPLVQNKVNIEKGFILNRYGVSSSGGCLITIFQLVVVFALYAIIYDIPRYVPEVNLLTEEQFTKTFSLFSYSILEAPGFNIDLRYMFPILTVALQFIQTLQNSVIQKSVNNGKLVGGISNALMMLMTFYFSISFPLICSVYWISKSASEIVLIFFMNLYFKKHDLKYFEEKERIKKNKNRRKRNLEPLGQVA